MIKLRNYFVCVVSHVCFWYQFSGTSFWYQFLVSMSWALVHAVDIADVIHALLLMRIGARVTVFHTEVLYGDERRDVQCCVYRALVAGTPSFTAVDQCFTIMMQPALTHCRINGVLWMLQYASTQF